MKKRDGFTLIELSIVISIMSLMLSGGISLFQQQAKYSKMQSDREKIASLKRAMDNYFATNGRLPCPSDPTISKSGTEHGKERMDSTGSSCVGSLLNSGNGRTIAFPNQFSYGITQSWLFGGIPTSALGLSDHDGYDSYGNHFTYVVLDSMANYVLYSQSSVYKNAIGYTRVDVNAATSNTGNLTINNSICSVKNFFGIFGDSSKTGDDANRIVYTPCNAAIYSANSGEAISGTINSLAYVIIGHGANGYGSWSSNGTPINISNNTMEASNSYQNYVNINGGAHNINSSKYSTSNTQMPLKFYSGQYSKNFDDILVWSTTSDLIKHFSQSILCHPKQHPGIINAEATLKTGGGPVEIGKTLTLNKIKATCGANGFWINPSTVV